MNKEFTSYLIMGILVSISTIAIAEDSPHEFSANVTLSTDYMYRGGSQTDEQPAISGGFDYGHASGFYVGVWASNVDFQDIGLPSSNIEIDYYGGVAGEFSNGISWDIGGLYYQYAGTKDSEEAAYGGDADFAEAYGSLGYTYSDVQFEPSIGVFFAWSPDYFGESGDSYYTAVDLGLSLPYGISLAGQIGFQEFDRASMTDYSHYSVGLSKDVAIFTLDATYYDSIDDADTFWGAGFEEALVFSISSSF